MSGRDTIMSATHPTLLAHHRQARGWSQARLADVSAISRTEISAIETGRLVPSVSVALRLASALGESVEALFGGAGSPAAAIWAWPSPRAGHRRGWQASVNGRLLTYPVEPTAAGTIPHDGVAVSGRVDQIAS